MSDAFVLKMTVMVPRSAIEDGADVGRLVGRALEEVAAALSSGDVDGKVVGQFSSQAVEGAEVGWRPEGF